MQNRDIQNEAKTIPEILEAFLVKGEPQQVKRCYNALRVRLNVNPYDAIAHIAARAELPIKHVGNICGVLK